MTDIIQKCAICNADFRPGSLDKDGKCPVCAAEYPEAKDRAEAIALNSPEINLGKKLDADGVRQIVKEELNAFKAELTAREKAKNLAKAREARGGKKGGDKEEAK